MEGRGQENRAEDVTLMSTEYERLDELDSIVSFLLEVKAQRGEEVGG